MLSGLRKLVSRRRFQRALSRWRGTARAAESMSLRQLTHAARRARMLRAPLDDVLREADSRLALPRIGSNNFVRPSDVDWSWRPDSFRGELPTSGQSSVQTRTKIGHELTVFHDCPDAQVTVRQFRNTREEDLAPFAVRLDVFEFNGSFLSFSLDLPQDVTQDISPKHLIRMDCIVETESPLEIFARLNLTHGPNTENVVRQLPMDGVHNTIEFDLGYVDFNPVRTEKLWVDLIFEQSQMNQITIRDLTFSRYPRSEM